jgi:hypothetical protein
MSMSENIGDREHSKFKEVDSLTSVNINLLNQLIPEKYDYIELGYTGSDITSVIFKSGGSSGTTVATLTLGYSGGNLVSVTRS